MNRLASLARQGAMVALLAALAGCSSSARDIEQLKLFLRQPRSPVSGTEYRVYPPDSIAITSQRVPEINGFGGVIRPDGKINLPLLGELSVAGKTPREIEDALKVAAREYYAQDADATVQVGGYNSQKIYIFGQVGAPGAIPWTGRDTLLDVLSRSQPTRLAWPQQIKLIRAQTPTKGGFVPPNRDDKERNEAAKTMPAKPAKGGLAIEMTIDLTQMYMYGDLSRNVLLQPDDVIYVPPHPLAAVGLALQDLLFPVGPVLEAARVPATVQNAVPSGGGN